MDAENYYEILGIGPDADDEEVKQAFRELAKTLHPDRNPGDAAAERRFKLVGTAYDALKDAGRRQTYNEWLAFNVGQKKSYRRQWSRLAAVLALLLLGPSAVLYGVVAFGGTNVFDELIGNVSVVAPESATPETKTATAVEAADKPAKDESAVQPESATIAGASESDPAEQDKAAPNALGGANAIESAGTSTPPEAEEYDTRSTNARARTNMLNSAAAPVSSDEAQAALQPTAAETANVASVKPDPAPPAPLDTPPSEASPNAGENGETGAIASARMLATLKEPEGAANPQTPRPQGKIAALTAPQSTPDTFSDCKSCPLMSLTFRPKTMLAEVNLAVSLSEITVAQWNACVEGGGCPPYHSEQEDPAAPVTGLSASNAGAYAEWLSAHTGERYRIVAPLGISERADTATRGNCDPVSKRRNLTGWDWLDEGPRRDCPPGSPPQATGSDASGFRVARPVRNEG